MVGGSDERERQLGDARATEGCAGASGRPSATAADAGDAGLGPATLVAVTVQVYVWPLVSPATVIGDAVPATVTGVVPSVHVAL